VVRDKEEDFHLQDWDLDHGCAFFHWHCTRTAGGVLRHQSLARTCLAARDSRLTGGVNDIPPKRKSLYAEIFYHYYD